MIKKRDEVVIKSDMRWVDISEEDAVDRVL